MNAIKVIMQTRIKLESIGKHVFIEPYLGVGVEKPLVVIIGDPAAVLNLSNHVTHCRPRDSLVVIVVIVFTS